MPVIAIDKVKSASEHKGSLIVLGDVMAGVSLIVTGDLTILGNVLDGAKITQCNLSDNQAAGVKIQGKMEGNVRISAEGPIECSNVGENSILKSGSKISAKDIGKGAHLSAIISIVAGNIGAKANLSAGKIQVEDIDGGSILSSASGIIAKKVAEDVTLDAITSVKCHEIKSSFKDFTKTTDNRSPEVTGEVAESRFSAKILREKFDKSPSICCIS